MSEQEKNTQQYDYAKKIADELIKNLEQGTAPWQKPWSPADGNDLPHNPNTGNNYSGGNMLLLMMQQRTDPRWMTYKQAQAIGAQVRKGEKATPIVKVINHKLITERDDNGRVKKDAEGNPITKAVSISPPIFKYHSVFNGEQMDGLPEWERKGVEQTWEDIDRAETILKNSGAAIRSVAGDRAYYNFIDDQITLPHKDQFQDSGNYYSTALHELGHWTGHVDRLDRDIAHRFGTEGYAKEELRAEIASMMLNRQLNLPHDPEQHASYVGSWVKVLQEEPLEILNAAKDAQKIQSYVMDLSQERAQEAAVLPSLEEAKVLYEERLSNLTEGERMLESAMVTSLTAVPIIGLSDDLKNDAMRNMYLNRIDHLAEFYPTPSDLAVKNDVEMDIDL